MIAWCPSGGHLALHQHVQAEIYYILSESGVVEVNGVQNRVSAGNVLWIPRDAIHGVFCGLEETLEWLYVFPEARV
jgi:mannose-6-phosphate isomerase-like protein (cupin superfamily)